MLSARPRGSQFGPGIRLVWPGSKNPGFGRSRPAGHSAGRACCRCHNVNDKPAFKLKANVGSSPIYLFLDKGSYLIVKTTTTVDQMGTSMNVDSYMTDYVDIDGVVMPKKTTAMANGMEAAVITLDKIEVNIPIEDSVFKVK